MTDIDLDFSKTTKPTPAQVRFVWNEMVEPSSRKVAALLNKRGAKISFKTVSRWHGANWEPKIWTKEPKVSAGPIKGIPKPIRAAIEKLPPAERAAILCETLPAVVPPQAQGEQVTQDEKLIGAKMPIDEQAFIMQLIEDLGKLELPELKSMQEKDRLIFNIVLMRSAARKANLLALLPRDSAALVVAATDARDSLSMIPPAEPNHQLNGHGNGMMLDVTPGNPVSNAIAAFKRKQAVA